MVRVRLGEEKSENNFDFRLVNKMIVQKALCKYLLHNLKVISFCYFSINFELLIKLKFIFILCLFSYKRIGS